MMLQMSDCSVLAHNVMKHGKSTQHIILYALARQPLLLGTARQCYVTAAMQCVEVLNGDAELVGS